MYVCGYIVIVYIVSVVSGRKLTLGYITGSQKREGDYFYNKPGQSISGAITFAVEVGSTIKIAHDMYLISIIYEYSIYVSRTITFHI